jgi:hypothetical protein
MSKKLIVTPGCEVAMNTLEDAAWFEVVSVMGPNLSVRDVTLGDNAALQWADISMVKQVRKGKSK